MRMLGAEPIPLDERDSGRSAKERASAGNTGHSAGAGNVTSEAATVSSISF